MKAGILRSALIASAIGCFLSPLATLHAADVPSLVSEKEGVRYFVFFEQPGVINYRGTLPNLPRTAPEKSGVKFNANRAEVVAYRDYLASEQDRMIDELEGALGRSLSALYRYDILHNAIVLELSADEALLVSQQPGVEHVEQVQQYELATDRGPSFIGADTIWSGLNTNNGGIGYRGEGMVIGVLDTGVNLAHPSFANDASCGFSAQNPKLVAAKDCINSANCTGPTPGDDNGHGSHTASTAGGNTHVATGGAMAGTEISGIAPCAQLITYKVCPTNSCEADAIQAAIQTALVDQVDVINYSISGGTNPWAPADSDRGFLDLVDAGTFVAASAGNTNAQVTNPIGAVNHRGPWVMTVANSTHDRINKNAIDVDGGPQDVYSLKSAAPFNADVTAMVADSQVLGNVLGCTSGGGFPPASMTGKIALISRGSCSFEEKINNAVAAGAIAVIVYNSNLGQPPILMAVGAATSVPSVMVARSDGLAISAHVTNNPNASATMHFETVFALEQSAGDILNAGSLRGPVAGGIEVTKPDITAPGTNIMAAVAGAPNAYDFLSGTSMSGPHVAGSAALVKGLRPTWTVPEIRSALMMTASKSGLKDFVNGTPNNGPWDADDVGSGRVDLTKAALAGLLMNETKDNFLAAEGDVANQRALNVASARNTFCTPNCSWTRTVRNALSGSSQWSVSAMNISPGFDIEVSPTSFSFNGDGIPAGDTIFSNGFEVGLPPVETQEIVITATPTANLTSLAFGEVVFTEDNNRSPDLHVTVSIMGTNQVGPPDIQVVPGSLQVNAQVGDPPVVSLLNVNNIGQSDLLWSETLVAPPFLWDQPVSGTSGIVSDFSTALNAGAYTANDFVVTTTTTLTTLFTQGFDNQNLLAAQPAISWAIYPDAGGVPAGDPETNPGAAVWTYSSPVLGPGVDITDNNISLDLGLAGEVVVLPPGTYWLTVYPTYTNDITIPGSPRWNWYQATPVGAGSQLISPQLFGGIPVWTATGAGGLGTAIEDTAFTVNGIATPGCGAPWLSINPTSGMVAPAGSDAVDVTLDPTGLIAGVYEANVCISSNDPDTPLVFVPVTFTVTDGGGVVYQQNFANVPDMFVNGGWFQQNNSEPLGPSTFVQGAVGGMSPGQDGSQTEFAVVNFNSTTGTGTISNWMLTPVITFDNNTSLSFYTKTIAGSIFPDRLEVRVSSAGNSTNVGVGSAAVGDFTTLLLEVNPGLVVGGYPESWTQFTVTNADGIPTNGSGRIAFRYFVTNGGPTGANSNIIGFDTLTIMAAGVNGQVAEETNNTPADPAQTSARPD